VDGDREGTMKTTITLLTLSAMLFAVSFPTEAQQPKKVYRIGYLQTSSREQLLHLTKALKEGMQDLGYVEGRDITFEHRFADGKPERLPALATELVRLKVDVIVTATNPTTVAAKLATSTIPIVMANGNDPVGAGLVASLARPGGNISGLTQDVGDELWGKRLELLKEVVPKLSRVAILWRPSFEPNATRKKPTEEVAQKLGLVVRFTEFQEADDFKNAFASMGKERVGGVLVFGDPVAFERRAQIADFAVRNRLPTIYNIREFVEVGGLMSYGASLADQWRRAATYVDKILKGAKPAELPVEQPMKFELIINLKTAKQIGLTIPPNVLARADRVIK
jgi:putative tryptophan/tyrosine transport system substrate-binding protein